MGNIKLTLASIDRSIYNFFLIEYVFDYSFNSGLLPIRNGDSYITGLLSTAFTNHGRFEIGVLRISYDETMNTFLPYFAYRHSDNWRELNVRNTSNNYFISRIYLI